MDIANEEQSGKKTAFSSLSKTRYAKIIDMAAKYMPEDRVEAFANDFCTIMNYDPTISVHTPARAASHRASIRKKAEELGTTTYVTSGRKQMYQRSKQAHVNNVDPNT